MVFGATSKEKIVGTAMASVLPDYGKPWFLVPHLLKLNLILIVPLLSSAAGGYDGSLMNGLQSMTEWQNEFGDPSGTLLGFVNAAMSFGALLGLPISGILPDRIGRKKTLLIGIIGIIIATIIQATATTLAQLIVARFLVGIGGQIGAQPSPMLIAELAYPTHRGKATSMYNTLFYAGGILASWATYGCTDRGDNWAWRIPVILQAGYPMVQLIFWVFVPESPRWLISKGRVDEARHVLGKFHAGGDTETPLVDLEVQEILAALEMEKQAKQTKWLDLFSTPGNRWRSYIAITLAVASQWTGLGVVSYYLTLVLDTIGITSSSEQTLINGILQIFNFAAAVAAASLVDFLGRRTLFLWSGVGMLISYTIWTACSAVFNNTGSTASGKAVLGFIFIFAFHYDIAYTPLLVSYPTEFYPYSLRSKGFTLVMFSCYGSLIIGSFCNSIALSSIGWKYYIVFCVLLLFILINSYFAFPETKGYSLEEISKIFDGAGIADLEVGSVVRLDDDEKTNDVEHIEVETSSDGKGSGK